MGNGVSGGRDCLPKGVKLSVYDWAVGWMIVIRWGVGLVLSGQVASRTGVVLCGDGGVLARG